MAQGIFCPVPGDKNAIQLRTDQCQQENYLLPADTGFFEDAEESSFLERAVGMDGNGDGYDFIFGLFLIYPVAAGLSGKNKTFFIKYFAEFFTADLWQLSHLRPVPVL